MKTLYATIIIMTLTSCAMPAGYLPTEQRIHSNYGSGVRMIHVNDSSLSDSFNTWSVEKVVNNSISPFSGTLICTFTVPRHDTPSYAYHNVELEPFQWKEYYSSTDMVSRFGVEQECRVERSGS